MSSPFNWRGQPSQLAEELRPHKGNKKPGRPITLPGQNPHGGAYSKAVAAEVTDDRVKGADSMFGVLP